MIILKSTINKICSYIENLERNIAIDMIDDNRLWLIDEDSNAGVLEIERNKKGTLIRGIDINRDICFMKGKAISKINVEKAISIMDKWNSEDRSGLHEYPTGWMKNE